MELSAVLLTPITQLLSHDAEEHGRGLRGWMLDYMQMASGPFRGSLTQFRLDNIQLYREDTDRPLMKRGASWPVFICDRIDTPMLQQPPL